MPIFRKGFSKNVAIVFTVPLMLGMQNPEVIALQKVLNQNPQTQIAETGPGSPGNETSYFGALTQAAVERFQTLYSNAILAPAGLASPTGLVGPLTLAELNVLATESVSQANSSSADFLAPYTVPSGSVPNIYATDQKIQSIQDSLDTIINNALAADQAPQINPANYQNTLAGSVIVTAISGHSGFAGATISIQAQNLDQVNNVYFCSPVASPNSSGTYSSCAAAFVIKNLAAPAGALSFALPAFPPGRYDIAVQNSHGFSNSSFFVILSAASKTVSVTSISPNSVRWGDTITISGSGFTPTGNEVVTTFDTIKNVPSPDGKTLSVRIAPDQMKEEAVLGTGKISIPDSVAVINDNGYTTGTGFTIAL